MAQEPAYERSGRGGAGNFRRPSNDPDNTSTAKGILKEIKDSASAILSTKGSSNNQPGKVEYVHHGRGGAGNLSTTSAQVTPVKSIIDEKGPTVAKPVVGRGGAGNLRSASKDREQAAGASERTAAGTGSGTGTTGGNGNVVDVPGANTTTTAIAEDDAEDVASAAVPPPVQAHLGEGREVVHDGN